MDDRLKDVQTSDLTDSRLNHEFVDWLKTKGLNWLLAFLLVACAFLGWDMWNRRKADQRDQAWIALSEATMPSTLTQSVATLHAETDGVANIALLRAADQYLNATQTGIFPGLTATDEGAVLDAEGREEMLENAMTIYGQIITRNSGATGFAAKPFVISALFGQAAVAESRGDVELATTKLQAAAKMAQPEYPQLTLQAESRIENLAEVTSIGDLPMAESLASASTPEDDTEFTTPVVNDLLDLFDSEPAVNVAPEEPAETPATP